MTVSGPFVDVVADKITMLEITHDERGNERPLLHVAGGETMQVCEPSQQIWEMVGTLFSTRTMSKG